MLLARAFVGFRSIPRRPLCPGRQAIEPVIQLMNISLEREGMDSSVDRLTRHYEFCLQFPAIARITFGSGSASLDVKMNAARPEAFKIAVGL